MSTKEYVRGWNDALTAYAQAQYDELIALGKYRDAADFANGYDPERKLITRWDSGEVSSLPTSQSGPSC